MRYLVFVLRGSGLRLGRGRHAELSEAESRVTQCAGGTLGEGIRSLLSLTNLSVIWCHETQVWSGFSARPSGAMALCGRRQ